MFVRFATALVSTALLTIATVDFASAADVRADQGGHHKAAAHRDRAPQHRIVTINMDIDFKPHKRPEEGKLGGFDPIVAEVHVGDRIRFTNTDDNQHTATGYSFGGQQIPDDYRFQGDPTKPSGDAIGASEWSTGNVRPHSVSSKVFMAKTPGTFYFACAYHQKIMRSAIVVKQ